MSDGPYGFPPPQPGEPQPGQPQGPGYPPPGGQPPPSYQPPSAPGSGPPGYPPSAPGYPPPGYPPAGPGYPPPGGQFPPPGGQYPAPPKSSNKGLWIGLGIAGVVLLLLCCGGGGFAVFSAAQNAKDEVEKAIDEASITPTPDPGSSPGQTTGTVGTPVDVGDLEVTVTAPTCSTAPLGSGTSKATPLNGQFCSMPLKVTNTGATSQVLSCARATLTTDRRKTTFYSISGSRAVNNGTCLASLAAGANWSGTIVYDIEAGDTPRAVVLTENYREYVTVNF